MPFLVCRHIKTNGVQCGSPAMRRAPFCYFHERFRMRTRGTGPQPGAKTELMRPVLDGNGNFSVEPHFEPEPGTFFTNTPIDLGPLEDAESVQVAISAVVNALAGNRMQMKRATALLYGLQLAAQNCRNLPRDAPDTDRMLREVAEHNGETVARVGLKDNEWWVYNDEDGNDENGSSPPEGSKVKSPQAEEITHKYNRKRILHGSTGSNRNE